jgi:hypothetical protein
VMGECDVEAKGDPSIFKLICKAVALARMLPISALRYGVCLLGRDKTGATGNRIPILY